MALVLPALTLPLYLALAHAPPHIICVFWALVVFALWWGLTDLTTQGGALSSVLEPSKSTKEGEELQEIPKEITGRVVSHVGSSFLVLVVYGIMVSSLGRCISGNQLMQAIGRTTSLHHAISIFNTRPILVV
jgi:hypothetical protein